MDSPRTDQPGRARHRPDAGHSRRRRCADITTCRTDFSACQHLLPTHRGTTMVARTLTQHAVPTTFGAKAASWLNGAVDAYQQLGALTIPVQIGGAGGTLAATTELAALAGHADRAGVSTELVHSVAATLGLDTRMPWHTTRGAGNRDR